MHGQQNIKFIIVVLANTSVNVLLEATNDKRSLFFRKSRGFEKNIKRREKKRANRRAYITTPTFHLSDCFCSAFNKFNSVCPSRSIPSILHNEA